MLLAIGANAKTGFTFQIACPEAYARNASIELVKRIPNLHSPMPLLERQECAKAGGILHMSPVVSQNSHMLGTSRNPQALLQNTFGSVLSLSLWPPLGIRLLRSAGNTVLYADCK